jgi:5-methylcytosine-specific restriction enzyme subunit McrC
LKIFNLTAFANLQFNRLNERYMPILRICEIIIRNGSIDVDSLGNYESFAFLIDMNKLFEQFIREYLIRNLSREFTISKGHQYLDHNNTIELEPDIDIKKNGHTVLIIDTKYKIIDDKESTRSDVSQVLDYCLIYKIQLGILLYPKFKDEISRSYRIKNTNIQVNVQVINIIGKDRIEFLHKLEMFRDSLLMLLEKKN